MKLWFIDSSKDEIKRSDAIRRDPDGYHIVGHGYVKNDLTFLKESEAKTALKRFIRNKIEELNEKLRSLG